MNWISPSFVFDRLLLLHSFRNLLVAEQLLILGSSHFEVVQLCRKSFTRERKKSFRPRDWIKICTQNFFLLFLPQNVLLSSKWLRWQDKASEKAEIEQSKKNFDSRFLSYILIDSADMKIVIFLVSTPILFLYMQSHCGFDACLLTFIWFPEDFKAQSDLQSNLNFCKQKFLVDRKW